MANRIKIRRNFRFSTVDFCLYYYTGANPTETKVVLPVHRSTNTCLSVTTDKKLQIVVSSTVSVTGSVSTRLPAVSSPPIATVSYTLAKPISLHGVESLWRSWRSPNYSRYSPSFIKPICSLPRSPELVIRHCPAAGDPRSHVQIMSLKPL